MLDVLSKSASGVPGLDDILSGGFTRGSLFLIAGSPGTGKTTLALRFLLEGAEVGGRNLYITLSETKDELLRGAASHGWTLAPNIDVFELRPAENLLNEDQQQSLLHSSHLELGETVKAIVDAVERAKPNRIVLDSLSEIRLLAQSSLRVQHRPRGYSLGRVDPSLRQRETPHAADRQPKSGGINATHPFQHGRKFKLHELVERATGEPMSTGPAIFRRSMASSIS